MKKAMAVSSILLLLGGFLYMLFANPHIPLLDANRMLLAETEEASYCAGVVYAATGGWGDAQQVVQCQEELEEERSTEVDHTIVLPTFCEVMEESLPITAEVCLRVVAEGQYWPTMEGNLTSSWNRAFPYPLKSLDPVDPEGRGNARETNDRTVIPVIDSTTTTTAPEGETTTTEEETTTP